MTLQEFLEVKKEFSLGHLTTENFNSMTKDLSFIANKDSQKALEILKDVDVKALDLLEGYFEKLHLIKEAVANTFARGGRVFICGCGATGRLALSCEFIFRMSFKTNQVISFMAGGDYALIKSVESFEDKTHYGARQLEELGFTEGDLLIAVTEGGETSFVIGAAHKACEISSNNPFFIYCNPDEELEKIERSKKVINKQEIQKVSLNVGAMAISGSTRMQATTVQMIACISALTKYNLSYEDYKSYISKLITNLKGLDYSSCSALVNEESNIYDNGGIVTYLSDMELAICVLTDTTERAPTFSLAPFETNEDNYQSLCYLSIKDQVVSHKAWSALLGREPRCLSWSDIEKKLDKGALYSFDVSASAIDRRKSLNKNHHLFKVENLNEELKFSLNDQIASFRMTDDLILRHLSTKLLLNAHSTIVMCKMNRVRGNVMSWVKPSNLKLIDRATRYIVHLSDNKYSYKKSLEKVFIGLKNNSSNESIVLNSLKALDADGQV